MTLVYLDTETTGLDPARHHVWEIAYAVDDGPILCEQVPAPIASAHPKALILNGYFDRHQPIIDPEIAAKFEADLLDALDGATLVGANPAFDAAFLKARWGEAPWRYRMLDIEAYALPWVGGNVPLGLNGIRNKLHDQGSPIPVPDHTAAKDVEVLRACHNALRDYYNGHLS